MRNVPNIIVTGTPGVGKTTHCEILAQDTGLKHLSINDIVKQRDCHDGYDDDFNSWIVDEDKVLSLSLVPNSELITAKLLDSIEDEVKQGGYLVDWHACDLFPKSWIDLVVVLRVDSTLLFDRLKARDYPEAKLQENLDSEIMEVLLQEARDSYDEEIIVELTSNTTEDMESNVERIEAWINQWKKDNAQ